MAWIVLAVTALVVVWIAFRRSDARLNNDPSEVPERKDFYGSNDPPT